MRYLTIRCDGPGCEQEASRLFAALPASSYSPTGPDGYASPGRWHTLTYQGMEDAHFCGYPCLAKWAAAQQLPKGAAQTLADVLPAPAPAAAASAPDVPDVPDIADQPTMHLALTVDAAPAASQPVAAG